MTFTQKLTNCKNLLLLTGALMMFVAVSCAPKYDPKPAPTRALPELTTGIATFKGDAIDNFYLNFTSLGNVAIEEYGIVYAFLPDTTAVDLVIGGAYPTAKFTEAPKLGANSKTFNIGLQAGTHTLSYRAYAKVAGGEVRYASNRVNKTF
ncbi:hypothetical protein SAMN04487996_11977 [Dyadobacter soli]|uniref:Uncharacterized protein n=1 Tax=Dyadobacter soli TaxID=659014 RepID=A0A1G7URC3_9BACT|nr:hypothetical protein [Dyadobacter soli]SDG49898.1 hypothetical protein SAMN04487996_11977 [Dyadobacter soli]